MTEEVERLWAGVVGWLTRHAPATAQAFGPPASDAMIAAVATAMGRPLPDDLVQWWRRVDGMPQSMERLIPPMYTPLSCVDALATRRMVLDVMADAWGEEPEDADLNDMLFREWYLPIAVDHCGQTMYADLEAGPWFGQVGVHDHEQGVGRAYWTSVTHLLTEVRDGLVYGAPALSRTRLSDGPFRAHVLPDGRLQWVGEG
jgi:cell wall assembly regulator SMI1